MTDLNRALALHRQGKLAQALPLYEAILARHPGEPGALHFSGLCLFQLGKAEAGLKRLKAASAAQPENPDFLLNLASALKQASQWEEAKKAFEQLLALKLDHPAALHNLAELAMQESRFDEALAHCRRLGEIEGESEHLLNARVTTLVRAGWAEDALAQLNAWQEQGHGPLSPDNHFQRSLALADLGRIAESAQALEPIFAQNPRHPAALWQRGLCHFDAGDLEAARHDFASAVAANPRMPLARAYLAVAEEELGRQEEAAKVAEDLIKQVPSLAPVWEAQLYRRAQREKQGEDIAFRAFTASNLRDALTASPPEGLILEFGVYTGRSIAVLAESGAPVYGFDSFKGLPEGWNAHEDKGAYDAKGRLPEVPENVTLVQGWFDETLEGFLETHKGPLRLANIDCDIYSSTAYVLGQLRERIEPGSLLIFDEYFGYPAWRDHEFKAFQESLLEAGWNARYLALSPMTRQALVEIC